MANSKRGLGTVAPISDDEGSAHTCLRVPRWRFADKKLGHRLLRMCEQAHRLDGFNAWDVPVRRFRSRQSRVQRA